jgi:flagellar basal-body rod protein FlgG
MRSLSVASLDLAIQGDGWFRIEMPNGDEAYTRAGTFQKSADGEIVTADGYRVAQGITISDDATSISINSTGEIEATIAGQTTPQNLGQFELVTFANPAGLESIGENLYRETPSSGTATSGLPGQSGYGSLLQGFLETSNVNAVAQITELISAQRAYELNSKVITTSDEMMSTVNQMR